MAYRSRALVVVALTIFVDAFIYGIIVPVLPLYTKTLGLSSFQLGLIFAAYSAALLLLSVPFGVISDRFGRKNIMIFGMAALAVTTVAFALARTFPALLLIRLLQGVSASVTWVVGPALLADLYCPAERGGKMGLAMMGNNFGFLFGPVAGGFLYDWGGYQAPFAVSAFLTILVLAAVVFFIKEPARRQLSQQQISLKELLQNRILLVGCGMMLLASVGFGFIDPLLPGYFADKFAASPTTIGWLFSAISFTSLLAQPLFGRLSDRLGRVPVIAVGILTTAVVLPLLTLAPSVKGSMLVMAMLGVTYGLMMAPISPLLADAITQENNQTSFGAVFGLNNTAFSLGYTAGPLLGGAFVDRWLLKYLFLTYGVVLVCYLPIMIGGARGLAHPGDIKIEAKRSS